MNATLRIYLGFTLLLLAVTLCFGVIASFAYLYPAFYNQYLPFYQLRPMHVSAALFWVISGGTVGILFYKNEVFNTHSGMADKLFIYTWIASIILVFAFYSFKKFGGREYWEFPPMLSVPILIAWCALMYSYFNAWRKRQQNAPLYIWMWTTGISFFLITFVEQNLYQISWFRASFLRELTVQWKSNGAMVGAWNQMIYGTSLYVMVKLSGNKQLAQNNKAYFFYFLGLTNLMFNWGHHIYNVPTASWIRHVSYIISMTEWIIFISIIQNFKSSLNEHKKHSHLTTYRFLIASEYWIFLNLTLALMMSIPAINRYTHGTHITVAHAMGATIGINTMILLASIGYMIRIDHVQKKIRKRIAIGFTVTQVSLLVFWIALIIAGIMKGYLLVAKQVADFNVVMQPVNNILKIFSFAGFFLFLGMMIILYYYFARLRTLKKRTHLATKEYIDDGDTACVRAIMEEMKQD